MSDSLIATDLVYQTEVSTTDSDRENKIYIEMVLNSVTGPPEILSK